MFRNDATLREAAGARVFEAAYAHWKAKSRSWFDGTPASVDDRLKATQRLLAMARSTGLANRHTVTDVVQAQVPALEQECRRLVAVSDTLLGAPTAPPAARTRRTAVNRTASRRSSPQLRAAARAFLADQNTTDRDELLTRARRHATDRTGTLSRRHAALLVGAFLSEVDAQASRPRRTAARPRRAAVADFDAALMFVG